jgi:hypothetical protein
MKAVVGSLYRLHSVLHSRIYRQFTSYWVCHISVLISQQVGNHSSIVNISIDVDPSDPPVLAEIDNLAVSNILYCVIAHLEVPDPGNFLEIPM